MTDRMSRVLGAVILATTAILAAATIGLIVAGASAPSFRSWGFRGFLVLFALAFGAIGALITRRLPSNRVGWLFGAIGLTFGIAGCATEYVTYGVLVSPGSLPGVSTVGWLVAWMWVPPAGLATTMLPLLFPDGRLLAKRWRPVAWLALVAIATLAIVSALLPGPIDNFPLLDNPLGWSRLDPDGTRASPAIVGAFVLVAISVVLSASSLVLRFRRSSGVERQQLKWFAVAAAVAALVLAGPGTMFNALSTGSPNVSSSKLSETVTILAFLGIPMATGVAILRHRLFDIDLIIRRGVVYGALTILLAGAYVLAVVLLQALLAPLTAGDTLAVAASTLAVAALFGPVRSRVQASVDRVFYRSRYDATRAASSFTDRIRAGVELDRIADEFGSILDRTMQPTTASIWLRGSRTDDRRPNP